MLKATPLGAAGGGPHSNNSDKAMTVAKLRGARERKHREGGKCEGRKSPAERNPELPANNRF